MSLSKLSTALTGQPFSIKTEWLFFFFTPLLPPLPSVPAPSMTYLSLSFTPQKVAFEFFKERGAIELQQKPRIADYWALMRSTPSLPSSRKHLMLFFFFCLAWRIDQASKKCRVGRLKKRRGLEGGEGRRGKVVVHSSVCVLQPCVEGQEKKKKWEVAGTEGSRERDVCVCV